VKNYFNEMIGKSEGVSRYAPAATAPKAQIFAKVSKAIAPCGAECEQNPRARSAKLRWAVKG